MPRYYITFESNGYALWDGRTGRCLVNVHHADAVRHTRLVLVCKRLNVRNIARNRQYGESQADFTARRAAKLAQK